MEKKQPKLNLEASKEAPKKIRRIRSCYMPAKEGVYERKRNQRAAELIILDKKGNELFPVVKVVPDKGLKVRDIMDRYTRGLPVETGKQAQVWPGEDMTHDSPDLNKLAQMDAMEKKDMARSVKFKIPKQPEAEPPKVEPTPPGAPNP